ncbi:MAG: cobalamin biosynthesis protein CbiM [Chloroflexi bacterium]|jgi:cobalt/nickel transport system permease protein|nr:cobalamin biosynthesis protein CbiM [Chloroflexota bacterium]MBT4004293.1 cobalamin biosynthesis protein CbiM [Chloroflexota bacterium]MBT4305710.1 cobalamin biosynthesis protein CbiM [Chloroflexota bacterium]MBT4533534.1 cobalamin biosynthesis protein CbiM [Chloroflexota bacterium]MBT4681823.1 cobalamin biosynthesis protein CbiM [Chloroflexota bacterium]
MYLSPTPLHIPDGFLSILISILFWAISIIFVGLAICRSQKELEDRQIPLMGVMAAFIFAAQMINFPVAGGTSGHLLGGALAAITLGPWAGILVMTSVVALQGLLFQDGGLLVMGANIFNMGILTTLVGYSFYRIAIHQKKNIRLASAGIAAFLGVLAAALMTAIQLWLSGTSPAKIVFPAMLGIHSLIGIGEALITVATLGFIYKVRPTILSLQNIEEKAKKGWVIPGFTIAILVVLLSPLASTNPDGLEKVANELGFIELSQASIFEIFPDYILPIFGDGNFSNIFAGIIGLLLVGLFAYFIGKFINKRKTS